MNQNKINVQFLREKFRKEYIEIDAYNETSLAVLKFFILEPMVFEMR